MDSSIWSGWISSMSGLTLRGAVAPSECLNSFGAPFDVFADDAHFDGSTAAWYCSSLTFSIQSTD
jgi:hypothetical protein